MCDRCVIFDLDGTLVDSRFDLANAINLMRQDYKLESLSLEKITSYIGNGATKLCERALAGTEHNVIEAVDRFKAHYRRHLTDHTICYPGVEPGLEVLHAADMPCAVVTNKPQEEAESILRDLGIAQYFALIVGGGGNFPLKPNPAALLYFAKENGSNPANCFMVGDHYTDLEAGFNAGMKTLFVKWGFGQPRNQKYDYIADSFAAGVKIILET